MEDKRDLRDPQKLGEALLQRIHHSNPRATTKPKPSWFAKNHLPGIIIPDYSDGPYMSAPPHEHHMYGFDFNDIDPSGD